MEELHEKPRLGPTRGGELRHAHLSFRQKTYLIGLVLFGVVLLVFWPATRNQFINYDDPVYVTENPRVQNGLTWANLKWALTTDHAANWHPLTWLSHMTDCQLYGSRPWGPHLTSVLLHAMNTMLLFLALRWMTGASWRSLMVAALFGVHPLRVESVAWIAERKDVLSAFFFMLTLLAYAEYVQRSRVKSRKSRLFYVLTLVVFTFGLMSKPMLVTVPFVLLLLDWWPLNRVPIPDDAQGFKRIGYPVKLIYEKVPFILLAAVSSAVTFVIQQSGTAMVTTLSVNVRAENALVSCCRYVGKLFCPVDLAVYYPYTNGWPLAVLLACAVALAVVSSFAFMLSRRFRYFLVGWFWYLGTLAPVIGLVQVGTQSMADRYTYIPTIGILVTVVWGLHELAGGRRYWKVSLVTVGTAASMVCAVLTCRQISCWHDSETLFRHSLAITKENGVALNNLGRALGEKGRLDEAKEEFLAALRLNANDPFACEGLGVLSMKNRDYDGAARYLREALKVEPKNAVTHYNLGIVMAREGLLNEAISEFAAAVRLNPDYAEAYNNFGAALAMSGRFNDAISQYRESIRLKPDNAVTHKNLGVALSGLGRLDEAIDEFAKAVRLQPDYVEAKERLKAALEFKANPRP